MLSRIDPCHVIVTAIPSRRLVLHIHNWVCSKVGAARIRKRESSMPKAGRSETSISRTMVADIQVRTSIATSRTRLAVHRSVDRTSHWGGRDA